MMMMTCVNFASPGKILDVSPNGTKLSCFKAIAGASIFNEMNIGARSRLVLNVLSHGCINAVEMQKSACGVNVRS